MTMTRRNDGADLCWNVVELCYEGVFDPVDEKLESHHHEQVRDENPEVVCKTTKCV